MGLLRSKKSYTMAIATKPLVMASEIAGIAPMRAFIKQENRVVPVRFRLAKKRKKQPEFIERKREEPAPRKRVETAAAILPSVQIAPREAVQLTPVPNSAPGEPSPKKAAQPTLPFADPPTRKREGFTWDASREIE